MDQAEQDSKDRKQCSDSALWEQYVMVAITEVNIS